MNLLYDKLLQILNSRLNNNVMTVTLNREILISLYEHPKTKDVTIIIPPKHTAILL